MLLSYSIRFSSKSFSEPALIFSSGQIRQGRGLVDDVAIPLCLFLKTGLITNYHFTHHCITTIFLIALDPFPGPCTSIFVSFFLLDLIEISMSTAKSPFSQLFGFCRSPLQQSKTLTFQAAPVDSHLLSFRLS